MVYYNCLWEPGKSGKVYDEPDWALRKDLIKDGFKLLVDQFEKENKQQMGETAKTVPPFSSFHTFKVSSPHPFCPCQSSLSQGKETDKEN